jgi:spore coat polysaccharide biosynthesis protein SpsF (cytidylyltransferase family)
MSVAVVLQARFGSHRLPGKAMLPLGSSFILDTIAKRALRISADSHWFATTTLAEDDALAQTCLELGYQVFRGEVEDVLSRFEAVATASGAEVIVRVTGDNPLISFELSNEMVSEFSKFHSRYDSMRPDEAWPIGLLPEVFRASSLQKIRKGLKPSETYHLSHVTSRLSRVGEVCFFQLKQDWIGLEAWRLTIDEPRDYLFFTEISRIYAPKLLEEICSSEILEIFRQNRNLACLNGDVRQKLIEEG